MRVLGRLALPVWLCVLGAIVMYVFFVVVASIPPALASRSAARDFVLTGKPYQAILQLDPGSKVHVAGGIAKRAD